jgi:DNA-binding SARP family transcriptional activator
MYGATAPLSRQRTQHGPRPVLTPEASGKRLAEIVTLPVRTASPMHNAEAAYQALRNEQPGSAELQLLGGFRLAVGGRLVDVGRTGQRLLAVVACRGRQATRSQIAHALWPDTASDRAHANLRTALYRLSRRVPDILHGTASYLQLSAGMQIDIEIATRAANRILNEDPSADQAPLAEALRANLYEDLLPDWDEEWLGDHQYRHRQLRLTALEKLSADLAAAGQHGAAVQAALAAVQADALRDSAHETLIRACLAQGNRHEAYTHYTAYRRILRDELGLDPPADLGRLLASA